MGGAGGTAWLNEVLGRLGQFEIEKTMVVLDGITSGCGRNVIGTSFRVNLREQLAGFGAATNDQHLSSGA